MSDAPHIRYFNMGPWPIYVGFTTKPKAFRREMKRLAINPAPEFTVNDHSDAAAHYLEKDGGLTVIITMREPDGRSPEQVAGLLAHEATHVAQELWSQIGEKEPGREAEAYLVQMITQCCMQEVFDTGRSRKFEP